MAGTPESNFIVEMRDVLKLFPGVVALHHVNFQLKPGEVHVLLGENGAGKSTLIKVMSGAYVADDGEIPVRLGEHAHELQLRNVPLVPRISSEIWTQSRGSRLCGAAQERCTASGTRVQK